MLIKEDKLNVDLIKNKNNWKEATLPSLRNQDWKKKVKISHKKVNKSLTNIPTGNITEINKLVHAGVKLVGDNIGVPQREPK